MTLTAWLERSKSSIDRRLAAKAQRVDAVFDDEFWKILGSLGLLEELDSGRLRCYYTGVVLSRDNVGGLVGTTDGPRLIAETSVQPDG